MLRLAFYNLLSKKLSSLLSWVSLTLSVGIISVLLMVQDHYEKKFVQDITGIDMVIGAKGSPLQLILSAVFHIDAPTGNIPYAEAEKWMQHPFVAKAIPLAYGDSYKGYSIVGSDSSLIRHYNAALAKGRFFSDNFEVVIGSSIAKSLQLGIGSSFFSTHGNDDHGEAHTNHAYNVAGILQPTGRIVDQLIISNIESVWQIHDHGDAHADHEGHHHETEELEHRHSVVRGEHYSYPSSAVETAVTTGHKRPEGKELTAVLIQFSNPMGIVQLPRLISKNSNLMPAVPAVEINRMFSLLGIGASVLIYIGAGIMLLSGFSIFVTLFNALKERKYEVALLRATGTSRGKIVLLLLAEALMLGIAGVISGIALGRLLLWLMSHYLARGYKMDFHFAVALLPGELVLIVIAILLTTLAALLPALKAGYINISKTLASG